jgi:phospholipase C
MPNLDADIQSGNLPAVSIVKPDGLLDGHPASSKLDLQEALTRKIIGEVQNNPTLWAHTAILITEDEGGGYWDSGYIQPLDFFGDGTRIPAIMVSPYSRGGQVSHTYADQVSFLKFVEWNWRLPPVSSGHCKAGSCAVMRSAFRSTAKKATAAALHSECGSSQDVAARTCTLAYCVLSLPLPLLLPLPLPLPLPLKLNIVVRSPIAGPLIGA